MTDAEKKATYPEIKEYVMEHYGYKIPSLYIAQVKQKCGIIERENYNKSKCEHPRQGNAHRRKRRLLWKLCNILG